jgi:hypothetical protein
LGCGFGVDAEKLRVKAEKLGVSFFSAHIDPLDDRNIDNVISYHKDLGNPCIISKLFISGKIHAETLARISHTRGVAGVP